jgi:hypothetical protein
VGNPDGAGFTCAALMNRQLAWLIAWLFPGQPQHLAFEGQEL